MPNMTEKKADELKRAVDARRISMALTFMCGAWGVIVALAARATISLNDVLDLRTPQVDQAFKTMVIHSGVALAAIIVYILLRWCRSLSVAWPRALLAVCILFGIASLDCIVGFFYPLSGRETPLYVYHPRRGYMYQKNCIVSTGEVDIEFNRFGLRGPPIPSIKTPGEYRILFLGDSIVFGYLLKNDETPVDLTRQAIEQRDAPRSVRCINAGVTGYTTWQELDLLQYEGAAIEPDLVVLVFYVNDVIDMAGVERGVVAARMWDLGLPASTHWSGLIRMVANNLAAREQASIQQQRDLWAQSHVYSPRHPAGLTGKEDFYRDPPLPSLTDAWRKTYLELDAIVDTCEQMNAKLMIVHATDTLELSKEANHRVPSMLVGQWARTRGLSFVDLTDDFDAATDGDPQRIEAMFLDGTHLSPAGSRIMAKRMTDEILKDAIGELD